MWLLLKGRQIFSGRGYHLRQAETNPLVEHRTDGRLEARPTQNQTKHSAEFVRNRRVLVIADELELDDPFILELLQQTQHRRWITDIDPVDSLQDVSGLNPYFFVETHGGNVVKTESVCRSVHHVRHGSSLG